MSMIGGFAISRRSRLAQTVAMTNQDRKMLKIDVALFNMAFARDVVFHDDRPQKSYLDKRSGDILWVYDEDKDAEIHGGIPVERNMALRLKIAGTPERYLEIPGRSHGDHHELLLEFITSNWTTDVDLRDRASRAYSGSIGRWKETVDDERIVAAFYNFRDIRLTEMAEEFLRQHGIEPEWT